MEQTEANIKGRTGKDDPRRRDATAETELPGGFEQQWKRRRRKRIIGAVAAIAVVAVLGVFAFQGYRYLQKLNSEAQEDVSTTTYRVRQVTAGSIEATLSSSGALAALGSETLVSAYDGEAAAVSVGVGDTVAAGDALIRIESDAIDLERETLYEELNSVNQQMASTTEYASAARITADIYGVLKDIKAEKGDRVADVVAEYGYLCLISTDGRMQIKIETDRLLPYDKVTVETGEDASKTGTVTDVTDGVATIQIGTNTYPVGQAATVRDADGTEIGSGELSLVEYVRVTGGEGVIDAVNYKENTEVYRSTALFALTDAPHTGSYLALMEQRDTILAQIDALAEAEHIVAPFDGRIMELNVAEGGDILAGDALLVIQSDEGYTISLSVDELDITQLAVGQAATVALDAMDGTFDGAVTYLSYTNSSTSSVARYAVTVTAPDIDGALPGMSATCTVVTASSGEGLTVPVDAVQSVDGQDVVYLAPADAVFGGAYAQTEIDLSLLTAVPVETGMSDGTTILVTGGIADGDLILVPVVTTTAVYEAEEESASFFNMDMMQQGGMMPGGAMQGGTPPDMSSRGRGNRRDDG